MEGVHPTAPTMRAHSPLLVKFAAFSLIASALIAAGLGWFVGRHMAEAAVRDAVRTSVDMVQTVITPRLTADDFGPPTSESVAEWRGRLRDVIGRMGISKVKVWNASGRVVFANTPELIGRVFPLVEEEDLRQALEGRVASTLSAGRPGGNDAGDAHLLEIYAPVLLLGSHQIAGAYEISVPSGPLEARVEEIKRFIYQAWAGAFALLYASLFLFMKWAGRQLLRHEADLQSAVVGTVRALVNAVDSKDSYTASHSSLVADYAVTTAQTLRLSGDVIDDLRMAAYLHDLGKIGIPDEVLRKPAALTPEEGRQMRKHPTIAAHILEEVPFSPRLKLAVKHNHERWDGMGYPDGLQADEIPIEARILSIADAYEAMTSDRPYRPTVGHVAAVAELRRHAGSQFDPAIVDAFVQAIETRRAGDRVQTPINATNPKPEFGRLTNL
jgi:HD-GYP domain-containing protein (c-di-GMP phosphodiesterase class II)